MEEKRKFPRFCAVVDVVYTRRNAFDETNISFTKDISKGGIRIFVYEDFKCGDLLDLKIHLPRNDEPITAIGKITWIQKLPGDKTTEKEKFETGIEFMKINLEEKKKLDKYLISFIR